MPQLILLLYALQMDKVQLRRCLKKLSAIREDASMLRLSDRGNLHLALSLSHLLTTATIIARTALMREESRGPHYRTDFPIQDDASFGQSILIAHADGRFQYRNCSLK